MKYLEYTEHFMYKCENCLCMSRLSVITATYLVHEET